MAPFDPSTPQLGFSFEEPQPVRRILPVHELVAQIRDRVEREYADVWVEGEISNLRSAPSGHIYFTLKDAEAQLPIVLFRRQALLLRFLPEDGLRVLIRGRISVYELRGQLQLVAETMEPAGAGSLQLAFEQLKEQLKAEGLFDAGRKRPLPMFPRTVGIVTSPTGAVIQDFLNIVRRRHSGLNVLLYPVPVQGESAPAEITEAIEALNSAGDLVDLIVVARGGGSLEDMAAFNNERVARAIATSRLPVVSAIGHETDFTIADFAADLRAPTPSAAAELITEAQHKIAEHLSTQLHRLERAIQFQLLQARQRLTRMTVNQADSRIEGLLYRLGQRLDDATQRLDDTLITELRHCQNRIAKLTAVVLQNDPRQSLAHARIHLADCRARLDRCVERMLQSSASQLGALGARLHSLSPLAVLGRGYALVLTADGTLIHSTGQLATGDRLTTRLADGSFISCVETIPSKSGASNAPVQTKRGKKKTL